MKRLLLAAAAFACAAMPSFAQSVPAGFVTLTESSLLTSSGATANNATACAQISGSPTSIVPIAVRLTTGHTVVKSKVCANVVNGAFSLVLADTSQTQPQNVCYALTVIDNVSGRSLLDSGYNCVQPASTASWCAGGVCNLDNYQPNQPALALVQTGQQGIQGPPGCVVGATCTTITPTGVKALQESDGLGGLQVASPSDTLNSIDSKNANFTNLLPPLNNFLMISRDILTVGPTGSFDQQCVGIGNSVFWNHQTGQYNLAYIGFGAFGSNSAHPCDYTNRTETGFEQMGLASSNDGIQWTKNPNNPILPVNPDSSAPDSGSISFPEILWDTDLQQWHAYYICSTHAGYENGQNNTCHATTPSLSTNPVVWTRLGLYIAANDVPWAGHTANSQVYRLDHVKFNGKWYIFFNAGTAATFEDIGVAVASTLSEKPTVSPNRVVCSKKTAAGTDCTDANRFTDNDGIADPLVLPFGHQFSMSGWSTNPTYQTWFVTTTDKDFPFGWVKQTTVTRNNIERHTPLNINGQLLMIGQENLTGIHLFAIAQAPQPKIDLRASTNSEDETDYNESNNVTGTAGCWATTNWSKWCWKSLGTITGITDFLLIDKVLHHQSFSFHSQGSLNDQFRIGTHNSLVWMTTDDVTAGTQQGELSQCFAPGTFAASTSTHCDGLGSFLAARHTAQADYSTADGTAGQFMVQGKTNGNKALSFGFNTTLNWGFLQAYEASVAYRPLKLNPGGGQVQIGPGGLQLPLTGSGNAYACIDSTGAVYRSGTPCS